MLRENWKEPDLEFAWLKHLLQGAIKLKKNVFDFIIMVTLTDECQKP